MQLEQSLPFSQTFSLKELDADAHNVEEIVVSLYGNLRPQLVAYAFHLGGSMLDAEDAVQIAFLHLYDQLIDIREIVNLRGWLYRVVHNLAVKRGQRQVGEAAVAQRFAEARASNES
jgi:RNA polymerase sigma-70 factor, ECF subfamily